MPVSSSRNSSADPTNSFSPSTQLLEIPDFFLSEMIYCIWPIPSTQVALRQGRRSSLGIWRDRKLDSMLDSSVAEMTHAERQNG